MDFEQDRNPSPPSEILDNEDLLPDKIGDSIYSKKWLYQALMDILKACDTPPQESQIPESSSHSDAAADSDKDSKSDMIELDPKIEEEACTLWDMSSSRDVAEFMNETGVPGIMLDIMEKTRSPRLLEIVIGILGNMSSYHSVCTSISENKSLLSSILHISGTSDTPTILQIYRVIRCGLSNECSKAMWIEALDDNPIFFDNLKFIFENSLNGMVISGTYQVLYPVLSAKLQYKITWTEPPFLNSIIEAAKQLQLLKSDNRLDNFFSVLDVLCEYPPNVKIIAEHWTELKPLFTPYFLSLNEEDPLPEDLYVAAIFSCFDTFKDIVKTETIDRELIFPDVRVLKSMCKLGCSVNSMVLKVRRDNLKIVDMENPVDDLGVQFLKRREERDGRTYIHMMTDYQFHKWKCLGDVIVETAKVLLNYAEKEEEKEILNETINSEVYKGNINVLII